VLCNQNASAQLRTKAAQGPRLQVYVINLLRPNVCVCVCVCVCATNASAHLRTKAAHGPSRVLMYLGSRRCAKRGRHLLQEATYGTMLITLCYVCVSKIPMYLGSRRCAKRGRHLLQEATYSVVISVCVSKYAGSVCVTTYLCV